MAGQSNAALLREMHDAFGRRDLDAVVARCSEDMTIHSSLGSYPPGHAGVRRWWGDVIEAFAVGTPRFGLIVQLRDVVIALVEASWLGRSSGVEYDAGRVQVSRWRNGRATSWAFYLSVDEAVEAAGLDAMQAEAWSNVLLCLGVADAINRHDVDGALAAYHPEAEAQPGVLAAVEGVEIVRGRDGIAAFIENIWAAWDDYEIRPYEARWEGGDKILCLTRISARGGASGVGIDEEIAYLVTIRDGLIFRQKTYLDAGEALTAAGLTP